MARPGRLELPTLCLEGTRSIQLSYGRLIHSKRFSIPEAIICWRVSRRRSFSSPDSAPFLRAESRNSGRLSPTLQIVTYAILPLDPLTSAANSLALASICLQPFSGFFIYHLPFCHVRFFWVNTQSTTHHRTPQRLSLPLSRLHVPSCATGIARIPNNAFIFSALQPVKTYPSSLFSKSFSKLA
jgi:hypothetical protein